MSVPLVVLPAGGDDEQSPLSKLHATLLHSLSQTPSPGQLGGQPGAHHSSDDEGDDVSVPLVALPAEGDDEQSPPSKLHATLLHVLSQKLSPGQLSGQPGAHHSSDDVSVPLVVLPAEGDGEQSPLSKLHATLLHSLSQTPSPGQLGGQPGAHPSDDEGDDVFVPLFALPAEGDCSYARSCIDVQPLAGSQISLQSSPSKLHASLKHGISQTPSPGQPGSQPVAHIGAFGGDGGRGGDGGGRMRRLSILLLIHDLNAEARTYTPYPIGRAQPWPQLTVPM